MTQATRSVCGTAPRLDAVPDTVTEHPLAPRIRAALHGVNDPEIRRPITDLGMVEAIDVDADNRVRVEVLLTVSGCPMKDTLRRDVTAAVLGRARCRGGRGRRSG